MSDRVFICYARLDGDFVLKLAADLKSRGIPVWIDQWDLAAAEDWDRAVDRALRACSRLVVVLSPAAAASGEVRGELRTALDLGKELFPVLYEPCEMPRQLRLIQYIDFSSGGPGYDAALDHLYLALIGRQPPPVESERLRFLGTLQRLPADARAFDSEFDKATALALSKQLSDRQFMALHDLRLHQLRDPGTVGIVKSLALERIGGPAWEAEPVFNALTLFGFLTPSTDPRERSHPDPGFDYSPLFWAYTNLMRHAGTGRFERDEGPLGSEYWLSSD